MNFEFWCTGKTNANEFKAWELEFVKRINAFTKLEIHIIEASRHKEARIQKAEEAHRAINRLKSTDYLVLLDEAGDRFTSVNFASYLAKKMTLSGKKRIVFLVGGAYGFDDLVYDKADAKIRLSDMTFSHQLIRLLFLEQFYRAMTIIHNHPYHNE